MKHEDKKHFDISKPRRLGPDPTSKPIIVGHHPMMPDPMIREEREKAPRPINVTSDGDEPESLVVKQPGLSDISAPHETSPALTPSAKPSPQPETLTHIAATESVPGAVFSPSGSTPEASTSLPEPKMPDVPAAPTVTQPLEPVPPTQPEPPSGQELHIPAGHTTIHHKPRLWVWVLAVIIILAWAYAAIDALTDVKLPYEFFKNLTNDSTPTFEL